MHLQDIDFELVILEYIESKERFYNVYVLSEKRENINVFNRYFCAVIGTHLVSNVTRQTTTTQSRDGRRGTCFGVEHKSNFHVSPKNTTGIVNSIYIYIYEIDVMITFSHNIYH